MKTSETGGCQTKTVVFAFSKLAKTSPKTTSKTSPKPLMKTRFEFPYYKKKKVKNKHPRISKAKPKKKKNIDQTYALDMNVRTIKK